MRSKLWTVGVKNWIKGLGVAVVSGVATAGYQALQTGERMQVAQIGMVALISGVSYIVTSFGTNSKGQLLTPEPKE